MAAMVHERLRTAIAKAWLGSYLFVLDVVPKVSIVLTRCANATVHHCRYALALPVDSLQLIEPSARSASVYVHV